MKKIWIPLICSFLLISCSSEKQSDDKEYASESTNGIVTESKVTTDDTKDNSLSESTRTVDPATLPAKEPDIVESEHRRIDQRSYRTDAQTMTNDDVTIVVTQTRTGYETYQGETAALLGFTPGAEQPYLQTNIQITNLTDKTITLFAQTFRIVTNNGATYEAALNSTQIPDLAPGESAQDIALIFHVKGDPNAVTSYTLHAGDLYANNETKAQSDLSVNVAVQR